MANGTPTSPTASSSSDNESLVQHVARAVKNLATRVLFGCSNTKEEALVKKLEFNIASRKKAFGVAYMNLVLKKATEEELKACLDTAVADIDKITEEIKVHEQNKEKNNEELQRKIQESKPVPSTPVAGAAATPTPSPESKVSTQESAAAAFTPVAEKVAAPEGPLEPKVESATAPAKIQTETVSVPAAAKTELAPISESAPTSEPAVAF